VQLPSNDIDTGTPHRELSVRILLRCNELVLIDTYQQVDSEADSDSSAPERMDVDDVDSLSASTVRVLIS
jgi:hypothetical protein